MHTMIILDKTR